MFDFLKKKPQSQPDNYLNQPHDSTVTAGVNNKVVYAVLYDENNRPVNIPVGDTEYWLRKGFKQTPADPEKAIIELYATLDAFKLAVEAFHQGCKSDKSIDHADGANLQSALKAADELTSAWDLFVNSALLTYPSVEGEPVVMVNDAGQEYRIDPAQVELYQKSFGLKVKE